ncbi:conserved Plasmodium protein, unknown function [Plasmodium berghei]|uniref:Uncharacterized protein n=2 Tax=Plasmodium berghei TaxID=5821 RepID=A0A509AP66_PLABA|nr:conserved Plasmodium protein, unknown function [Plasmodium berghei ANKA]CXI99605.1 conserved Plasmodium protein, unknown function [Plasmodium berghei]SCL97887.1 conserved Plasmodium protein, unknown function [Plasmodium berghei]SCM18502.1 conserved Plasmodium protein, unknown function [Plasmodium berghei]SCN27935.1 conserved Plasmodium protein, unknown function [Plasmodium berghei]VUC57818.1 conserved Plasmodium protein, unknown function [Plasmodium berghei ANKA]|eukprot:XP_034423588.1 conserved Plasmodium protein, unknown function [Plasmodium berghei ANKA]
MNFDNFVNNLYGKDVFDDENSKYIKDTIFPCLLPLVILVNNEKEKHTYFNVCDYGNEKDRITNLYDERNTCNMEQIDIFATNKLKANSTELFEIQQEVLKKYIDINPILLLREYLIEEYNERSKTKETPE